jgi:succinate dehydrogenase/fumarate reductase flavoprotein subunit
LHYNINYPSRDDRNWVHDTIVPPGEVFELDEEFQESLKKTGNR